MKFKKYILEEYKKAFNYIRESRKFIYFSVILFFVIMFIGFFRLPIYQDEIRDILVGASSGEVSTLNIFIHNLRIDFIKLNLGFFLGIIPIFISMVNAYVLGFAIADSGIFLRPLNLFSLLIIVILEVSVGLIATGLGLRLGFSIFRKKFWDDLNNNFRVFILIIVPTLFISAFVEVLFIKMMIYW